MYGYVYLVRSLGYLLIYHSPPFKDQFSLVWYLPHGSLAILLLWN